MSALGEAVAEVLSGVVFDGWVEITKATHERFGWFAATIVAISPIVILALVIWLIVAAAI